jgi:uncharacterized membrane protein YvlD (DUF360 family)
MLKKVLRHFAIDTFTLYAVSQFTTGLVFEKGIETLFLAGAGLTAASLLAKPIINLLLLPLNLITFNLFKWVSSAIALYLVTLLIPGFKVVKFVFEGLSSAWIDLPALNLGGGLAYVAFAFVISLISSFLYWLL